MTIYGLDILLSQNLASLFFHVRFQLLLPDLHIVSQKAGKVAWYSHLLKNFPKFVVIHTVKGFGMVNKAEIDVFLELSSFFYNPMDVGNLISGSCAFSKTKFGLGVQNEAGQRVLPRELIEFCQENTMVIANTLFQQHKRRLYTGTSPDGQH